MKSCLIMLTSSFPFGTGETFIENEIPYYKDSFDKIIILPIELDPDAKLTRELPSGVAAINASAKKQSIARLGDMIKGIKNLISPSELYKFDREQIGSDLKRRMFFEYFCNRSLRSGADCLKLLEKFDLPQYDSITIYSYWFFATAMAGVVLKEHISEFCENIKLVSRAHRYDIYEDKNAFNYLPLREYLLERYDCVFPCSENGTQHLASRYPQFAEKIKTAYLGTTDKGEATSSQSGMHIVSCAQIMDIKRVEKTIDILERLETLGCTDISWTHIGDGNRREMTESAAKKRLKTTKVTFLGKISNSAVYDFYRNNPVDLFLSTSSSEGLPVSMMEALSFGIPIVSTDVGGVSEIVLDGQTGRLLDVDASDEKFAEIIKEFYDMDSLRYNMYREASRHHWEKNFNAKDNYNKFFSRMTASPIF